MPALPYLQQLAASTAPAMLAAHRTACLVTGMMPTTVQAGFCIPSITAGEACVTVHQQQLHRIASGQGFIAALDQSGGSTPKALKLYGIEESAYSNDAEMFALVHQMRERIVSSAAFNGERVLGAILFERTLDDTFAGQQAAHYLWHDKQVVPFLKIDQGLQNEADGVQLLKPIAGLEALLAKAKAKGVFGTKERSVIKANNQSGIDAVLDQQFALAQQVLDAGLVPIIEPEVDIQAADKVAIEQTLKQGLLARLDKLDASTPVILKLTLPSVDGAFQELVQHPSVLKVVALSGGYSRDDANARLANNPGVVASFSRALTEGLSAQQSEEQFDQALDAAIESIYRASIA
jgi:fructose-bisphosphate aldolase class I